MSWNPEKFFFIEKTLQNIATWIHGIDLSRELGLKYPKAICVCLNVFHPRSQESQVKKIKIDLLPINSSFLWDFWYRKGKQAYWGQSRRGLDLGTQKGQLWLPHIETVGRVLVWSDCLYTRDDILLPSIVLLCRWLNFPKPGNQHVQPKMLMMSYRLLPSCGLLSIDLMSWWDGGLLNCSSSV